MRRWTVRRWVAAAAAAVLSALVLGIPTELIPNPVFARKIEAPLWTYPSLAITAVLAGLLLATYVRNEPRTTGERRVDLEEASPEEARRVTMGGLLSFFAIGCPTCNKLVLLALGSSGAITWFEPVQPLLALGGIAVLVWALRRRLQNDVSCAMPTETISPPARR
jgi:H+/Cl- antiporter ClcA